MQTQMRVNAVSKIMNPRTFQPLGQILVLDKCVNSSLPQFSDRSIKLTNRACHYIFAHGEEALASQGVENCIL